ncbi:MAG TPA: DHHA1 domain-containing protein, partial [Bacillota bacterium]
VADRLRCGPLEASERVDELLEQQRALERTLAQQKQQAARAAAERLLSASQRIDGVNVVIGRAPVDDAEALRRMGDYLRDRLGSAVVVLGAEAGGRALLVAMATADIVRRGFHAGKLVQRIAPLVGGGGGGRPDVAQAGGKEPDQLEEALSTARSLIEQDLGAARQRA